MGPCEHDKEYLRPMEQRVFLDYLKNCLPLKKDPTPQSSFIS